MKTITKVLIMAIIILVILIVIFILKVGSEDSWMCVAGQWVQHGHPSAPMPNWSCG